MMQAKADEGETVQDELGGGDLGAGRTHRSHAASAAHRDPARRSGRGQDHAGKGNRRGLGAATEDEVTSPTFTIVHEYAGTSVRLFHLDLYRLETEEQIAVLGIDEMASYPDSLLLVEWGERFESIVNRAAGEIYMEHGEGDERGLIVRLKE